MVYFQGLFQIQKTAPGTDIKGHFLFKKTVKGNSDLTNPYLHSIFTVLQVKIKVKTIFEKINY